VATTIVPKRPEIALATSARAASVRPRRSCSQTPPPSARREIAAAMIVRVSSSSQPRLIAMPRKRTAAKRIATPPIQARTRPPKTASKSTAVRGAGGSASLRSDQASFSMSHLAAPI
jgi:hypothetical protein